MQGYLVADCGVSLATRKRVLRLRSLESAVSLWSPYLLHQKLRSPVSLFLVLHVVDDLSILFDCPKYQIKTGNVGSLPSKVNSS